MRVVVGGLGEDVVHVAKRVIDGQGAQHALRGGAMLAIDARVALCAWYTLMGGSRMSRRGCGPRGKARHR